MSPEPQLVLVSNRGPATFERADDGSLQPRRGGGGLVTALKGLVHHREALWVASAMSAEDAEMAREHGGGAFDCELEGVTYRIRLVESDPEAYEAFYGVVANPLLWFIQHYLWDLSNAPDIRQADVDAYENGYCAVNRDLADAVLEEIDGVDGAVVMLHDYHLYTAPKYIREARPDVFLHHFVHIPWTQPDAWRVLPRDMCEDLFEGILSNDIVAFHTHSYRRNFLLCCRELFDLEVDERAGVVRMDGREVWVRTYPLPISAETFRKNAQSAAVHQYERRMLRRRREHLILRVDRADLSKNVLRGFTAFDLFLEQHPEFLERVTFIAHLIPSRQDVPEYAEYLERIEALVAVVDHGHQRLDALQVLGVLGHVLARRDQVGDEGDPLEELGVLLEEQVEGGEAAEHVLRQVGPVHAQDQVLAPAAQHPALVLVHGGALGVLAERLGRDRERVGAHPHLATVHSDHAGALVHLQVEQLAAAEQEVAPVGMGVERDDVVGQDSLEEVLAHVAGQHAPGVWLGPRDVDEVVQEHVRPRLADVLGRRVEVVVVEHHHGPVDAVDLLQHGVGQIAVHRAVAVLVGVHVRLADVRGVGEIPQVVLDEPQQRVRHHAVEGLVGLRIGLHQADPVGHALQLAVECSAAVLARHLGVLRGHGRCHPEGFAVVH